MFAANSWNLRAYNFEDSVFSEIAYLNNKKGAIEDITVVADSLILLANDVNGLWAYNYSRIGEVTHVKAPITRHFSLSQNYPNPFNPITTISYQLPASSPVKLIIYNQRGQKVRTLIDQYQTVGNYEVRWCGRNSSGSYVASGTYFYRLITDGNVETQQMLLLR